MDHASWRNESLRGLYCVSAENQLPQIQAIFYYEDLSDIHLRIDFLDIRFKEIGNSYFLFAQLIIDGMQNKIELYNVDSSNLFFVDYLGLKTRVYGELDYDNDIVTIALNKDQLSSYKNNSIVRINWKIYKKNGELVDACSAEVGEDHSHEQTNICFVHHALQDYNDLFEIPISQYDPPRTFLETIVKDEKSCVDSSARNAEDDQVFDGYIYGITAHLETNTPCNLAMAYSLLSGLKCSPDNSGKIQDFFTLLHRSITTGIVSLTAETFENHPLPYFPLDFNNWSISFPLRAMPNILDLSTLPTTFWVSNRTWKETSNVIHAFKGTGIQLVVLDDYPHFNDYRDNLTHPPCHYYKDSFSGQGMVFIDTLAREAMVKDINTDEDYMCVLKLRERLIWQACEKGPHSITVYGDDFEKICNNGYFDGNKDNYNTFFVNNLNWIRSRPYIRIIQLEQILKEQWAPQQISMGSGTAPFIDGHDDAGFGYYRHIGINDLDNYGKGNHYDAWWDKWKGLSSQKLFGEHSYGLSDIGYGEMLTMVTRELEDLSNPSLKELGYIFLAANSHEMAFNGVGYNNKEPGLPPFFILSLSDHLRYSWVFTQIAFWIEYDSKQTSTRVLDIDLDGIEEVLMYNRQLLIIIDRCGGKGTFMFLRLGDRVCLISGNPSTWDYLQENGEWRRGSQVFGDTWTPSHNSIAAEIDHEVNNIISKQLHYEVNIGPENEAILTNDTLGIRKQISLHGDTLFIKYHEVPVNTRIRNGFSLDLAQWIKSGSRQNATNDGQVLSLSTSDKSIVLELKPSQGMSIAKNGKRILEDWIELIADHTDCAYMITVRS